MERKMVEYVKENGYPVNGCFDKIDNKFVVNLFYAAEMYVKKGNELNNAQLQKIIESHISKQVSVNDLRYKFIKENYKIITDINLCFPESMGSVKVWQWCYNNKKNPEVAKIIKKAEEYQLKKEIKNLSAKCSYIEKTFADYSDVLAARKVNGNTLMFPEEIHGNAYNDIYAFIWHNLNNIPVDEVRFNQMLEKINYSKRKNLKKRVVKAEKAKKDYYPIFKEYLDLCIDYAEIYGKLPEKDYRTKSGKNLYTFWRQLRYTTPTKYLPYKEEGLAAISKYFKYECA